MKTLVLFDFDGTITTKDTFPLFFKYTFGPFRFYAGFSLFLPYFFLHKFKLYDGEKFKIKLLAFYLKGKKQEWIENRGKEFIEILHTKKIIKPAFIEKIKGYKIAGADIAVVSASPDAWIKFFCEKHNITCICTKLEYTDGAFNGRLVGANCNGVEKKKRVQTQFDLNIFSKIIAFGDSPIGDQALMEIATEKNWV